MNQLLSSAVVVRTMVGVPFVDLHRCWCAAFSDYKIPLTISTDELIIRLNQDSYAPSESVGVFAGSQMIGFWLTGIRKINNKKIAYDAGTAIVPEWRGRGISKKLAHGIEVQMRNSKVDEYVLEVFCDNVAATQLYQQNGFVRTRKLNAYRMTPFEPNEPMPQKAMVRRISLDEAHEHNNLLDYVPSWQNSWQALKKVENSTISVNSEDSDGGVAYAVFQPTLKRFAQIGIDKVGMEREHSLLGSLLSYIRHEVSGLDYAEIINIPEGTARMIDLLYRSGFCDLVSLYEMVKGYRP